MKFLKSLKVPTHIINAELKCWHHQFPVDSLDIEESELPKPPIDDNKKIRSNLDIDEALVGKNNSELKNKLLLEKSIRDYKNGKNSKLVKEIIDSKPVPKSLQNVDLQIIVKSRIKESKRQILSSSQFIEQQNNLMILGRLPRFCDIIHSYYLMQKKSIISLTTIIDHLHNSESIDKSNIKEHVQYLTKSVPDWCYIITIGEEEWLKLIDKNNDSLYQKAKETLQDLYQQLVKDKIEL